MSKEILLDQEILKAIRNTKFGSVEVIIHDSKIVQVERKEKIRFQSLSRQRADHE
jgi:hypothetical protein